jgi:hypothetical protein
MFLGAHSFAPTTRAKLWAPIILLERRAFVRANTTPTRFAPYHMSDPLELIPCLPSEQLYVSTGGNTGLHERGIMKDFDLSKDGMEEGFSIKKDELFAKLENKEQMEHYAKVERSCFASIELVAIQRSSLRASGVREDGKPCAFAVSITAETTFHMDQNGMFTATGFYTRTASMSSTIGSGFASVTGVSTQCSHSGVHGSAVLLLDNRLFSPPWSTTRNWLGTDGPRT